MVYEVTVTSNRMTFSFHLFKIPPKPLATTDCLAWALYFQLNLKSNIYITLKLGKLTRTTLQQESREAAIVRQVGTAASRSSLLLVHLVSQEFN